MTAIQEPIPRGSKSFPDGDGDATCDKCHGRGVVSLELENKPRFVICEITTPCECVRERDVIRSVKRGWSALDEVPLRKSTPLKGKENQNLWVTTTDKALKSHLKRVAWDKGRNWFFRVINDAELMDSWLHNIPDDEVIDEDVRQARGGRKSSAEMILSDMVEMPALLVIVVGVKTARNSAMSELLLEALNRRAYGGKPTWIIDHPNYRLAVGHLSYDTIIGDLLSDWEKMELTEEGAVKKTKVKVPDLVLQSLSTMSSGETDPEVAEEAGSPGLLDDVMAKHMERERVKRNKNWEKKRS